MAERPRGLWLAYGVLAALLAAFWLFPGARVGDVAEAYGLRAVVFAAALSLLVFLHGARRMGLPRFLVTMSFLYAIALVVECVGVSTGMIFGRFAYAPEFPLKVLGLVPALAPWLWCGLSYVAFATTEAIAGPPRPAARWPAAARRALATACLLVAYDLVADPNHLVRGGWSFEGGGVWFGVPLHNFAGWLALGWVLAFVLHRLAARSPSDFRSGDRVLLVAYLTVLAHECLFALLVARN